MEEILFRARVRFNDDGEELEVVMSNYDTEGLPEDCEVFYSVYPVSDMDDLKQQLSELDDDFTVIDALPEHGWVASR